jgi:uncharacterized protein (DUF2235 family)
MKKRLIVCCDGTWNRADHVDHGKPAATNVCKLRNAIETSEDGEVLQRVHYEAGVGTRRWEHLLGGGIGVGLSRNTRNCYEFLVKNYEPGDELFFFGFSRGAFTARSLAGLVRNSGILRSENAGMIKAAYGLYRSRKPGNAPWESGAEAFRRANSHPEANITFIGVWDTVGALGIPIDGFRPPLLSKLWTFHDTTLSSAVLNAYHAISIDERRGPFEPTLWVQKVKEDGTPEPPPENQTVRQVWFAGVHADVGGGHSDPSLSEIPLRWMAEQARACGLVLKPNYLVVASGSIDDKTRNDGIELAPNPLGEQHDSMTFMYRRLFKPYDRHLKARRGDQIEGSLASTVRVRFDADAAYRPPGLEQWRGVVSDVQDLTAARPG